MARPFKRQVSTSRRPPNAPLSDEALAALPTQRLHKLLALAGLGSRRDMEELVASGRITINGKVAAVGAAVNERDIVRLDSRILHLPFEPELPKVLIYHKPEGEIVSQDDPEQRASVFDKLPRVRGAKWIAIGRLDMNTSGLLMFTTSGELANRFMHPRYEVEREYAVRIYGELTETQLSQLQMGIELDDGPANFDVITAQGGEGANHWYQVILREGRNREVRRLFEAMQTPVSRLIRVRFGPVALPPRLKRAMMMEMPPKQVQEILEWAGLSVPRAPLKQMSKREKERLGQAYTPKLRKPARERLALRDADERRQQAFELRNAPESEGRAPRRGAGRVNPASAAKGNEYTAKPSRAYAGKRPQESKRNSDNKRSADSRPASRERNPSKTPATKRPAVKRRRAF
jgi:23S rRNA pseudouridine2605 synthase